ncbi:MAG: hypothetical protein OEV42_12920 [Deltaproteobacteria bacterium]|nr:hypothetical protein [Deltaproteobacteria bacterium]
MTGLKKRGRSAAFFLCLILLLSTINLVKAEEVAEQGNEVELLSQEDIDIINNLELIEMMDMLEDYDIVEKYNREEEEDDDV